MDDVSAFVLAGGRSSRMGRDKASLMLGAATLLKRAVETARAAAGRVAIVGGAAIAAAAEELNAGWIADNFPGQGPLAGIEAALAASATEHNFVLAVDLPFVTSALARFLIERERASTALVTVPRAGGKLHPLCAAYRREFRARAAAALAAGKNKIEPLLHGCAEVVETAELVAHGFTAELFDNLNTPADLARAMHRG